MLRCLACTPGAGTSQQALHYGVTLATLAPVGGARTQQGYGRWCRHCCGMACLQSDGQIMGLYYAPFADYARTTHGLEMFETFFAGRGIALRTH
ncbi:hypothetical protein [Nonomuraea sp. B19D2]|uniref:hypothetical protein n=1 Tax=Nonomuraea sp. B19D2 TaxID=3159561 RepID=UPI0032DBAB94